MSFFIKCVAPTHQQGALYVVKDDKPHRLNHPDSLDRDWFLTELKAQQAKRKLERVYANYRSLKFFINRR